MTTLLLRRAPIISRISLRHSSSALPRIAQPELWKSVIPKFLRRSPESIERPSGLQRFWRNPATHVAGLGILCGSQAIQVIYVKNEAADKTRNVDAKIRLLNNVIERIKAGEPVDIEQELGTGNPTQEEEWQQLIDEIGDDSTWLRNRIPPRDRDIKTTKSTGNIVNSFSNIVSWFSGTETTSNPTSLSKPMNRSNSTYSRGANTQEHVVKAEVRPSFH